MPNPWDVPAWPESAPDSREAIFMAVGKCLSQWEQVEDRIAALFAVLTGSASYFDFDISPAVRAYGAVIGFQARTKMVQAAGKAFFHCYPETELETRFKILMDRSNGWSGRRNDVAHGSVGHLLQPRGWILGPGEFNSRKVHLTEGMSYAYTASTIDTFTVAFEVLDDDASTYFVDLRDWHVALTGTRPPLWRRPDSPLAQD